MIKKNWESLAQGVFFMSSEQIELFRRYLVDKKETGSGLFPEMCIMLTLEGRKIHQKDLEENSGQLV